MKSIAILLTDQKSINEDIISKSLDFLNKCKLKKIYFIGNKKLFKKIYLKTSNIKKFSFLNIKYNKKKNYDYLKKITRLGIKLFYDKEIKFIINMPLNKKKFLNNKHKGFTEFFSNQFKKKGGESMLLFNENFSVCPITTHIELQKVSNQITLKKVKQNIINIINFYKKILKKKDKQIVVLGLNPHASIDYVKKNKDKNIIHPVVKFFKKKKINITGPVSADTAFKSVKNKIFVGMYHDQVLIPFKIINGFNGVNITIGKEIIRLSPDHGTAENLKNKKRLINNTSFLECIKFCEKYA